MSPNLNDIFSRIAKNPGMTRNDEAIWREGKITKVDATKGVVYFTIGKDIKYEWGPAPYTKVVNQNTDDDGVGGDATHTHVATPPARGQRCLVVLVPVDDVGLRPWLVSWTSA